MKNVGNSSRGRSQGVPKIQVPHVYGASCGHLCDSTAFLLFSLLAAVTKSVETDRDTRRFGYGVATAFVVLGTGAG